MIYIYELTSFFESERLSILNFVLLCPYSLMQREAATFGGPCITACKEALCDRAISNSMRSHGLFRALLAVSEQASSALCQPSACLTQRLLSDVKAVFSVEEIPHASTSHGAVSRPPRSPSLGLSGQPRRHLSSHASSTQDKQQQHSVDIKISDMIVVRLESGSMALQADGACLASSGSTHVLATAVCDSSVAVEDDEDILPLQVPFPTQTISLCIPTGILRVLEAASSDGA